MKKEQSMPNFVELEHNVLKFWKQNDSFNKLRNQNAGKKRFRFLDGPATANNRLGIHHFWGRTLKDLTIRYNALKGRDCQYQNGFDAQGLWVEVNIEKELGLNGKPEIEKYGIDKFTNKCMERVKHFGNEITNQSIRMGQWMDCENSYYTNTDHNITSIWHFLKECDKNGWIVKKNSPMAWCPRCGTSLSEHEMSSSYHEVEHTAVFVKLPVKGKDFKMVAWTTTPWTLSANVALAVNPEFEYVKVNFQGDNIVLGKNRLKVLKEEVEILETFKGSDLVGLEYETCFPELREHNFAHKIVAWDEVDDAEGSCVVHIAPGCGAEDFELGQTLGLAEICPINEQGVMLESTGFLAGKKTTDVVDMVVDRLKADGKLLYAHKYKHSYPFCWRCKTDLVYKLISAWFIKMDEIRPMALKAIEDVEFKPEYAKKRMADWLANMGDWNISRSRFYGLPLPFYVCEKCGKTHVIGSLEELKAKAVNPELVEKLPNIHRPWIDDIKIKCECGCEISRIPEVGDVWLDAGITTFSTKKYFTDKKFFEENFPSDYVCEMIEQIKLWFYSLLIMSVVLTGKAPYKKIVTYQYVRDEHGGEFHKSGGNSLEADVVADKVGADVVRYLYSSSSPANDMRFGFSLTDEARRKLLGFWNVYTFFNTYACIDNPDLANFKPKFEELTISDKWLLESVNKFVKDSDSYYADDKCFMVVRDFEKLVDDISNFYIRSNRKRFWKSENKQDQLTAYWCLYSAIKTLIRIMAPITPFLSEHIWQNLVREVEKNETEFVMASGYPTAVMQADFGNVLENVAVARDIMSTAQRLRNENQLKVKQPLKTMYVSGKENLDEVLQDLGTIIKEELNIKELEKVSDDSKFNDEYLSVNFKKAGAVLKGEVQKLKNALSALSEEENAVVMAGYKAGKVSVGEFVDLACELFNLEKKPKSDFVIAHENGNTVVLDINLDEELVMEGHYREFVRGLQVLRKEANFDIDQRIYASFETPDEKLGEMIFKYLDKIKQEVLIKKLVLGEEMEEVAISKELEVGDSFIKVNMQSKEIKDANSTKLARL
ncbi:MAG: isoleucine--tRNA ligase [Clostridia bacterium]|nr:isoleucine--tRNA ligase [Clostridia bacterium]